MEGAMAAGGGDGEGGGKFVMIVDSVSWYRAVLARLKFEENSAEEAEAGRMLTDIEEVELDSSSLPSFPSNFPAVKQIPGTRFVVDGFRSAGSYSVSYFLSHFHSDHYTGITSLWNKGLIFCSEITASLVLQVLKVAPELVVALPMGKPVCVDGVEINLVDANHCPGAVQFLFRVPVDDAQQAGSQDSHHRYVHTGDMRYSAFMKEDASLSNFVGSDGVFLDTTYCNPKFVFPSQADAVGYVADTIYNLMQGGKAQNADDDSVEELQGNVSSDDSDECVENVGESVAKLHDSIDDRATTGGLGAVALEDEDVFRVARQGAMGSTNKSVLFLISTYVIGKEKILTAVSRKCNCLIYVNERKLSILKCLNLDDMGIFTTDPTKTSVHVVGWSFLGETWPYFRPNFGNMEKILAESGFCRVVGFVPTGWTYELKKKTFSVRRKGSCEIHLVPYSEHSNYDELREYVGYLRPKEIIPTVGLEGGGVDGKAIATMRKHFRNLVDETASKRKFLKCFSRRVVGESDSSFSKQTNVQDRLVGLQSDDIADIQTGDKEVSYTLPKAAFGRGARKRRREAVEDADEKDDVATSMDQKNTREDSTSASAETGFGGNKIIPSSKSEEMMITNGAREKNSTAPSTAAGQELDEQLRSVLPDWVTQRQVARLLRKANGDMNVAATQFYEQELDLMDESMGGQGINASPEDGELGVLSNNVSSSTQENTEGRGLVQSTSTFERSKLRSSATQGSPSAKKKSRQNTAKVQKPKARNARSTGKAAKSTLVKSENNGKTKVRAPVPTLSPGKKQASQPTILTFFKKVGKDLTPIELKSVRSDSDATEILDNRNDQVDDLDSATLTGVNVDNEAENVASTFPLSVPPDVEDDGIDQPATQLIEDIEELEVKGDRHPSDHGDGLSQLLLILDGSATKEEAEKLLEKVHDNVGEALNLYYSIKLKSEQEKLSSVSRVSIGCLIESTVNDREAGATSITKESDFSFGLKEIDSEILEVSKPGPSGGLVDLESPSRKSKAIMSASKHPLVTDSVGSVATPVGQYNPVEDACWKVGEPPPYVHLARAFDLVEHESGRLKTTDMLCNMFRSLLVLSPEDVLPAVYLATNRIAPDFENTDLNIGGSTVAAAISEATGTPRAKLRDMYNNMGDLGDVAQACRQNQSMLRPPPALRIRQVFATLHQISKESGNGSGARKKSLVLGLLRACREKETKYIVRTLVQNMRIGAMMRTVLHALAQAVVLHKCLPSDRPTEKAHESLKSKLQEASAAAVEAYNFLPNLDLLIPMLIKGGAEGLTANISVRAGTPIKPMLAKITNGIPEVLKRFQGKAFTCEYKYDGQRAQVHLQPDGFVRIFSRNGEDNTSRFPDVADIITSAMQSVTQLFIIDAEVVAVDRENGNNLLAFQHLSTRERGTKDGNIVQNIKVEVCVFLFDIMLANGESLVKLPLRERRKYMRATFPNVKPGYFQYASEITVEAEDAQPESTSTSQKLDNFLDEAFGASCEGLMVKSLDEDSTYMASKRSDSWLKVKRDYIEGLHDTLDLVPIGAWHGNGRKAGWYSPFLVACYDSNNEVYQSVCRVMSGFSDAFYRETKDFYSEERVLPKKPLYYQTREDCDVWFSAEVVWEIRGADLTISPVHQAGVGLVHPSRGISMRFPRFISVRTDKKPEDASSPSDIADLFHRQTRKLSVPSMGAEEKGDSD